MSMSAALNAPLVFEPLLRPMVWGGRRLETVLGRRLPTAETYGESWEVSDHAMHRSVVASGPHAGRTLRQLMVEQRQELLGPAAAAHAIFPWLIKLIDAHDWLSVQVHPDRATVQRLRPGEGSKTEAWFILDVAPGSRIYAGLLPGVDEAALRAALATGRVADCLHQFEPSPGDCVFLPAGTVHAVGGGVLMAEVQETSDATFRLFDWNRRDAQGRGRELHIEEALASIDWRQGPVQPVPVADYPDASQQLVRCDCFALDHIDAFRPVPLRGGTLQALIVVRGRAELHGPWGVDALAQGAVRILPAALADGQLLPRDGVGILWCTLAGERGM
jgi:mannose-6-phosphate isomerase